MKIKGIHYYCSLFDNSGYGEASRNNVKAIYEYGIPIKVANVSFAPQPELFKEESKLFDLLLNNNIEYNLCIYHLTPEQVPRLLEKDKINIIHTTWETSKLHPQWVIICNSVDGILVPSTWNVGVFKDSGVNVPVLKFPHIFNVDKFSNVKPLKAFDRFDKSLKFYSIFQWSERKNPYGLIRTFFSEFNESDDVVLFLKTYVANGTMKDSLWVIEEVTHIKNSIKKRQGENYPKIIVLTDLMDDSTVNSLHKSMDIYLAPVRGEGFGITQLDAVLAGNSVIATNYSAQTDFLNPEIHSLVSHQMMPVSNMPYIPWYLSDQYWAEINLSQFAEKMRFYYMYWKENGELPFEKERKKYIEEMKVQFSKETILKNLTEQLEVI